jgi:hypothetical protein
MIIGILGSLGDREIATTGTKPSDCGNGKTTLLTKLLYSEATRQDDQFPEGRKVICNYHTRYQGTEWGSPSWAEYRTSQEIFNHWMEVEEGHPDYGAIIGFTELSALINSAQRDTKLIAYIERCLNQRRKNGFDVIWDAQTLGSADKRWRDKTEYIYKPVKFHCEWNAEYKAFIPKEQCPLDNCNERHQIVVFIEKSPFPLSILDLTTPQMVLNAWEIGQLFDTNEKMEDVLHFNKEWLKQ